MNIDDLIEDLTGRGIQLWIEKDQLHYRAPKGTLHPTIHKLLAENKAEIRACLSARQRAEAGDLFAQIESDYAHRYQPFPLTDLQMAYWAGRGAALKIGNVGDHTYIELDTIALDLQRFEIALQRLIERHDMLRAVILPDGQQQILEHVSLPPIRVIDLRGLDSQLAADQLEHTRQRMEHQWLPVEHWPPFDLCVTLLDAQHARVHVSIETLFVDATSFSILAHEFMQFYSNPETTLEPLDFSFRDYALAIQEKFRRSERYQYSRAYWLKRLPDLPPAPDFPQVHLSNMPVQPRFVPRQAKLSAREWKRLKARAALSGVTPASVLLTAFAEVLTSWSKSPRFSINLHVCNREAFHPQIDAVAGNFTSLTVLAIDHSAPEIFEKRVQRIQKELVDNLEHRHYTGIHMLRDLARHRGESAKVILPVMFRSTLLQSDAGLHVASGPFQELVYYNTQTFQVLLDHHVSEVNEDLILHWSVVEEAFPTNFIDAMFDAYSRLLQHLSTTEAAWQKLPYPFLLQPQAEQRDRINQTREPLSEELLHTLFIKQVEQQPHSIAVVTLVHRLTYRQVYMGALQIAHWLRERDVHPNQLVGIVMEKGWEQIVATLGVLLAGAAYVPIDPALPTERLQYLLEKTEIAHILTQSWLYKKGALIREYQCFSVDTLDLDRNDISALEKPLEKLTTPQDLACVIYTSDASGFPKGVMVHHQGAMNTLLDINKRIDMGCNDKILALSDLSLEISIYDIFGTLAAGGTILLPSEENLRSPSAWLNLLIEEQVTIWNSAPALLHELVNCLGSTPASWEQVCLRVALLSGDEIPLSLPDQVKERIPGIQMIGLRGAIEASIWSVVHPIITLDPDRRSISYGNPMRNQRIYILNELLEPCPLEVPGQLYIGGVGLTRGYWHDEAKTQGNFLFHPSTGERLYKIGDTGCYLPDGTIEFLGREDFQIKIGGYRVEPGEIERALMQHPEVQQAIVTAAVEPSHSSKRLIAYVALRSEQEAASPLLEQSQISFDKHHLPMPTESISVRLRHFLGTKLPRYMIPSNIIVIDALSLTSNELFDRKSLPIPEEMLASESETTEI